MARVVGLLRGVNIGKRQLSMAAMRDGLAAAGCGRVETYVQSGNVVLDLPKGVGRDAAAWLGSAIGAIAGFDVTVVVRTAKQMAAVVEHAPNAGAEPKQRHVVFCSSNPATAVTTTELRDERAVVIAGDVHLFVPDGLGRAKLPVVVERELQRAGIVGTARNWNTVEALLRMVSEAPC